MPLVTAEPSRRARTANESSSGIELEEGDGGRHAPRCSIGLAAHDGHVAAEVDQRVFHAAFAQQREDAVGDVAFRDAAQIDAGQRVAQPSRRHRSR